MLEKMNWESVPSEDVNSIHVKKNCFGRKTDDLQDKI